MNGRGKRGFLVIFLDFYINIFIISWHAVHNNMLNISNSRIDWFYLPWNRKPPYTIFGWPIFNSQNMYLCAHAQYALKSLCTCAVCTFTFRVQDWRKGTVHHTLFISYCIQQLWSKCCSDDEMFVVDGSLVIEFGDSDNGPVSLNLNDYSKIIY